MPSTTNRGGARLYGGLVGPRRIPLPRRQEYVTIDEFFIGEDASAQGRLLISPRMMKEFLFPYYQQLVKKTVKRASSTLRDASMSEVDTDGVRGS